ncbi:hypothetical protein FO519_008071 [Halicephalobus sp. NKZ332]|nr:hypothetical protein FO519_008071 [Halicephalobus sp. NKZ332]
MADAAIVKNALLNIFGLDKEDENTFIARNLKGNQSDAKSVYGGFLFSQSLVVAQKTVGPGFLPHSMHSFFIFNASSSKPVVYKIQRIRDGRSFATRFVTAHQEDKIVFSIQISFHVKEEPAIFHQYTMPKAEPPENLKRQWDVAKEYAEKADAGELKINSNIRARMQWDIGSKNFSTIEWCPVNPEFFFSVVPNKSLTQLVWVRIRSPISDDREQHRALVAYITDATLGETGAKAHFSQGFIPSMFFSLDNHCWFHTDDFRVDEWMLYENESPVANNGRAFSLGRLWTRDGRLILSSAQESLHRTKIAKSSL